MSQQCTTSFQLDVHTKQKVERLAAARQSSTDALLREAIEDYVDRAEKREQFRQDTLASWEQYQATGLHLTEEDLDEWMAKLEAGEDVPAPQCHT